MDGSKVLQLDNNIIRIWLKCNVVLFISAVVLERVARVNYLLTSGSVIRAPPHLCENINPSMAWVENITPLNSATSQNQKFGKEFEDMMTG